MEEKPGVSSHHSGCLKVCPKRSCQSGGPVSVPPAASSYIKDQACILWSLSFYWAFVTAGIHSQYVLWHRLPALHWPPPTSLYRSATSVPALIQQIQGTLLPPGAQQLLQSFPPQGASTSPPPAGNLTSAESSATSDSSPSSSRTGTIVAAVAVPSVVLCLAAAAFAIAVRRRRRQRAVPGNKPSVARAVSGGTFDDALARHASIFSRER